MKIIQVENQVEGGKVALELLKKKLAQGAKTLGLATGSSPEGFYKQIVESDLDFSEMFSVNLDEYVGLQENDPQSYRYFMNQHLFNQKPFKASFLPNGAAKDLEAEVTFLPLNSLATALSFCRTDFLRTACPGMMKVRPT